MDTEEMHTENLTKDTKEAKGMAAAKAKTAVTMITEDTIVITAMAKADTVKAGVVAMANTKTNFSMGQASTKCTSNTTATTAKNWA